MSARSDRGRAAKVRRIADCLDELRWKISDNESSALTDAICSDEWELVEMAARYLANQSLPRLSKPRLKEYAETVAIGLSKIPNPQFTKAEILTYLESVHPNIFAVLGGERARSNWFRRVCPDVPEHRGYVSAQRARQMSSIIKDAVRMEKAGFPYFLGPVDKPNWI